MDEKERDEHDESTGGQVSEVQKMDPDDAETPISDSQSMAGQPEGESGRPDVGPIGPGAKPAAEEKHKR